MGLGDCVQNEDQAEEIQDKYKPTATGTNGELMASGAINSIKCSASNVFILNLMFMPGTVYLESQHEIKSASI